MTLVATNSDLLGACPGDGHAMPRISVIIPLEYHRGLATACIRGWVQEQDYPRHQYRVLIGVPADFDRNELEEIRSLLADRDLLLEFDQAHDMMLIEKVACQAGSDLLLFSESHCIPEPGALSYLVGIADANPDWDAFSAPTHGLTDNLLSRIECDIYSNDIRGKLQSHDWLRVLDQCFVIRRAAYDAVGGFRGEFGHFAEWLFAATMKMLGLKLGVAERAVVSHGYIGEYDDLEAFTVDFSYGQIKYLHQHSGESAAMLFPKIPELEAAVAQSPQERNRLMSYPAMDSWKTLGLALRKILHGETAGPLRSYLSWVAKSRDMSHPDLKKQLESAVKEASGVRRRLEKAIDREDAAMAHHRFVEWFACLVRKGRYTYLVESEQKVSWQANARIDDFPQGGRWQAAGGASCAHIFGTHDAEGTEQGEINWTLPCFQLMLPLHAGECQRVVLEWTAVRPINPTEILAVRLNGRVQPRSSISIEPTRLVIDAHIHSTGWHELAITVYPFKGGEDGRLLGVPLQSVTW